MSSPNPAARPATLCIHAGTYLDERTGGACSPIFPSTAYAFPNAANENFYPRYFNTPNQRVIEQKMAALEKGEAALVFGSGMAAITTLLFAHLKPGDHAVFQTDLYGGTLLFVEELTRFGVAVSFASTAEEFAASLRPETKVVYVESPSNPLLRGVESLVCVPSRTSHRKMGREERQRAGISDGLVRVSVGVEDIEDLQEDFLRALEVVGCS